MADDPHEPSKPPCIDTSNPTAVDHWCKELEMTPDELKRAVSQFGDVAEDVRKGLRK